MRIAFATGNKNKFEEAQKILGNGFELVTTASLGLTEDIPENQDTIKGNAVEKAMYVWDKLHINCFSDDTGLEVDALDGRPGVHSARYAGPDKDAIANCNKLLKELEGIPYEKRTARFRCVVALIQDGTLHTFEGICEGHITFEPSGTEGFGYDVIFKPDGFDTTLAQLRMENKNEISHRGAAMRQLVCYLQKNQK